MTSFSSSPAFAASMPEMDTDKYLSSANAPDIQEDVRLCIQSGARSMALNCAPLTYMTGGGMRALLNMARMMKAAGGAFSIKNLHGQPLDLFMACGYDAVIDVSDQAADMSAVFFA